MEILYLDSKIAVCVKPAGVLSTDEEGGMPSLLRGTLGADAPVYSVHRLDAPTGGVMVYARTRHAASDLSAAVRNGSFRKEYAAVLCGRPPEHAGTLRDLLARDTKRGITFVTDTPGRNAREAALDYETTASDAETSLVRVRLHTGRTHQIRCQFAARGCPVWGDRKYGAGEEGGLALWAFRLTFPHPVTGETMAFCALPPDIPPWSGAYREEIAAWTQN